MDSQWNSSLRATILLCERSVAHHQNKGNGRPKTLCNRSLLAAIVVVMVKHQDGEPLCTADAAVLCARRPAVVKSEEPSNPYRKVDFPKTAFLTVQLVLGSWPFCV